MNAEFAIGLPATLIYWSKNRHFIMMGITKTTRKKLKGYESANALWIIAMG